MEMYEGPADKSPGPDNENNIILIFFLIFPEIISRKTNTFFISVFEFSYTIEIAILAAFNNRREIFVHQAIFSG